MHLKEVDANLLVILDALLVDASVSRAAERLGRSASAISHALAKLREIFADELFVRAGQRLVPTAKAQELAPTVHVILAGMESLLRPAKPFDPSDTERDFAMTASEVGDLILVQPLRRRLEGLAPSVRVGWMPGQGEETIEALRQGRCHFAIDIESMELPAPDIRVLKLYDDKLATVARAGHPLSEQEADAESFAGSDHIAVSALPTIELLDRELAAQRLMCTPSPERMRLGFATPIPDVKQEDVQSICNRARRSLDFWSSNRREVENEEAPLGGRRRRLGVPGPSRNPCKNPSSRANMHVVKSFQ